jgi:hypothetical protein
VVKVAGAAAHRLKAEQAREAERGAGELKAEE